MGAVAECVGDERGWALEDEFADGTVARAQEVDAQVAQTIHDSVRMQVPPSEGARKEPRAVRTGAGAQVRAFREVLPYERRERLALRVVGMPYAD